MFKYKESGNLGLKMKVKIVREPTGKFFKGSKTTRLAHEGEPTPSTYILSNNTHSAIEQSRDASPKLEVLIEEIRSLALETFGSKANADTWLNSIQISLKDTPILFANSSDKAKEVIKILNAIQYGGVV